MSNVTALPRSSWLKRCKTNEKGRPFPNLANACLALREAPELKDSFAFDEMLRAPILLHEIGDPMSSPSRPMRDDDVALLAEWIQKAGIPGMPVRSP
jgi:hypothetical protein